MSRAIHFEQDPETTRCGQWIERLETRVSSGTRETVLATTSDRDRVTCKICKRCMRHDDMIQRISKGVRA